MTRTQILVPIRPEIYRKVFTPADQQRLAALGEVRCWTPTDTDDLAALLASKGAEILVTGWTTPPLPVDACLRAGVRMVAHSAGTVRVLLPRDLIERGVAVSQAAAALAPAVAEMAVTLALILLRKVQLFDRELWQNRDWLAVADAPPGQELASRRVGVVSASRSGIEFIRMIQGLGVRDIAVYDPYLGQERAAERNIRLTDVDDVFANSDLVAVHAPATPETRDLVGARQLALLPDGGILVNTARSWVVDQEALLKEVTSGRISAGLDVFDEEPLPNTSPFYGLPNVVVMPHKAGVTVEAEERQGGIAVDEVERFLTGAPLRHAITADTYDRLA